MTMNLPVIERTNQFLPYKYIVGRPGKGYYLACKNLFNALLTWFTYL